jgi:hypothetical protein
MSRKTPATLVFLTMISCLSAKITQAGVGDNAKSIPYSWHCSSLIARAQYYTLGNSDYCWYDDGWNGPGWYWCGDEWDNGFGWGGPYGWNGWDGGYWIRRHGSNRIGVWHPGVPRHGFLGGAPSPGLGASGAPASPGFHGGSPAFNGFGGGSFHGFGGGGGFHNGGGGTFPSGGHGGHR